MFSSPLVGPFNNSVIGMNRYGGLMPDVANLLAWYKGNIADGKLVAYYPYANHTTQQVKSSGFSGAAGDYPVPGLLTTDTITFSGPTGPSCTVNGILSFPADPNCWDIWVHRESEDWAYWPGINVGPPVKDPPITTWTELDASGNGHHLIGIMGTTIPERLDGSGTNYANEVGFSVADGSQYLDDAGGDVIGAGWRIPALVDGSGCAAYIPVLGDFKFAEYLLNEGSGQTVVNQVSPTIDGIADMVPYMEPITTLFTSNINATLTANFSEDKPTGINTTDLSSRVIFVDGTSRIDIGSSKARCPSAGTYTISLYVKSNTGAPQSFRFVVGGPGLGFPTSPDITVTDWELATFTFSLLAVGDLSALRLITNAAGESADLLFFRRPMLVAGVVAATYEANDYKMVLGNAYGASVVPAWNNYGVNCQGNKFYLSSYSDTPKTLAAFTAYFVVRKTGVEYLANWGAICEDTAFSGQIPLFYLLTREKALEGKFSTKTFRCDNEISVYDGNFHVVGFKYDGTYLYVFTDGVVYRSTAAADLTVTLKALYLSVHIAATYWPGDFSYAAFYRIAHSQQDIITMTEQIGTAMSARSITTGIKPALCSEGDSITAKISAPGGGYVTLAYLDGYSTAVNQTNISTGGSHITTLETRAGVTDAFFSARENYNNILTILIGANDLNLLGLTEWWSQLTSYMQDRKTAMSNLKIVVCTLTPQQNAAYNVNRAAANTLIRNSVGGGLIHSVCDFAADPVMGPDAAAYDVSLYADGLHPTLLGQQTLMPTYKAAIEALL